MNIIICTSCTAEQTYPTGGPYYYGDYKHYLIPFQPIEQLTHEEAIKRKVYYISYFNDKGQITLFEKYYKGKPEFTDKYYYRKNGTLEKRETIRLNSETKVQLFDENGKLIK